MLFKTNNRNGILFCELPQNFNFEIVEREEIRLSIRNENCIFSDLVKLEIAEDIETGDEFYRIYKGTKHIYFEKNNQTHHIFFVDKGYIIKEKGKTIETL